MVLNKQETLDTSASPDFLILAVLTHDKSRPLARRPAPGPPRQQTYNPGFRTTSYRRILSSSHPMRNHPKCQLLIVITSTHRIAYCRVQRGRAGWAGRALSPQHRSQHLHLG